MTSEPVVIPEVLREAAKIFLEELKNHAAFFRSIESQSDINPHSIAIAERFHLIKGGAGFLKLLELKDIAADGENCFRKGQPEPGTKAKLVSALEVITSEITRLESDLANNDTP